MSGCGAGDLRLARLALRAAALEIRSEILGRDRETGVDARRVDGARVDFDAFPDALRVFHAGRVRLTGALRADARPARVDRRLETVAAFALVQRDGASAEVG